jgi:TetR/AcrR family transcriptional regulator, regulator of biofilm formation and stress response
MRAKGNPRGDRTRQGLLEATLGIIAAEGVRAVTQRRVAAYAGVSVGLIPYYFDSTGALIVGALEELADRETRRLRAMQAVAAELKDDIEGLVELLVDDVRQSSGARKREVIASFALTLEIPLGTVDRDAFDAWEQAQEAFYGAVASSAGADDPAHVASFLLASSDGLALYSALGTDPEQMYRAAGVGFTLLLRSLRGQPGRSAGDGAPLVRLDVATSRELLH